MLLLKKLNKTKSQTNKKTPTHNHPTLPTITLPCCSSFKLLAQISVNMKLIPAVKDLPHGYTQEVTLLDILDPYIQIVYSTPLNLFKPFPPTHHHSI